MAVSDLSHQKNVAEVAVLITKAKSLGEKYAPSSDAFNLSSLTKQLETAKSRLNRVRVAEERSVGAVESRTETLNALEHLFSDSNVVVEDVASVFIEKLNHVYELEGKGVEQVLRSQKMYDLIAASMNEIVNSDNVESLLKDVKLIKARAAEFEVRNRNVVYARLAVETAKKMRDDFLYDSRGLMNKAKRVKKYIEAGVDPDSAG